jgi:hypothetical protein
MARIASSDGSLRAARPNVVLVQLEALLASGIDVYIGWGIRSLDEQDDDADRGVQRAFEKLGERYRWNFKYKRLGHTHAKVLICDRRFMIVTSFNWLSFKGDPSRTFRDERGILVSVADEIDRQFDEWTRRFDATSRPVPSAPAGRPQAAQARPARTPKAPAARRERAPADPPRPPPASPSMNLKQAGDGVEISWSPLSNATRIRVEVVSADGESKRTRVEGRETRVRVGDLAGLAQPLAVTLRATDAGGHEVATLSGSISVRQ